MVLGATVAERSTCAEFSELNCQSLPCGLRWNSAGTERVRSHEDSLQIAARWRTGSSRRSVGAVVEVVTSTRRLPFGPCQGKTRRIHHEYSLARAWTESTCSRTVRI